MKTKLMAGIATGLVTGLILIGGLSVTLSTAAPAERVSLCHLEKKVDPTLLFNDGHVIEVSVAACEAHCKHGDHPMPIPADNDAHPNRQCARIHVINGLPECEVNTPVADICGVEACIARCKASGV